MNHHVHLSLNDLIIPSGISLIIHNGPEVVFDLPLGYMIINSTGTIRIVHDQVKPGFHLQTSIRELFIYDISHEDITCYLFGQEISKCYDDKELPTPMILLNHAVIKRGIDFKLVETNIMISECLSVQKTVQGLLLMSYESKSPFDERQRSNSKIEFDKYLAVLRDEYYKQHQQ
jgi:hypothetical protein